MFDSFSAELFSNLLWFHTFYFIGDLIVFLCLSSIKITVEKLIRKPVVLLSILIVVLNVIPFIFDQGRILLIDIIRGLFSEDIRAKIHINNLGFHIIGIVSFLFCYLIFKSNKKLTPNETVMGNEQGHS